jgi:hypothetical protein
MTGIWVRKESRAPDTLFTSPEIGFNIPRNLYAHQLGIPIHIAPESLSTCPVLCRNANSTPVRFFLPYSVHSKEFRTPTKPCRLRLASQHSILCKF